MNENPPQKVEKKSLDIKTIVFGILSVFHATGLAVVARSIYDAFKADSAEDPGKHLMDIYQNNLFTSLAEFKTCQVIVSSENKFAKALSTLITNNNIRGVKAILEHLTNSDSIIKLKNDISLKRPSNRLNFSQYIDKTIARELSFFSNAKIHFLKTL